jgi:predicted AlkP superfamily phosphohydrolase/phosphomutase
VIAIGLDSVEPSLLEAWMDAGALPNLARLRAEGVYGRLESADRQFKAEVPWTCFLTGCSARTIGYWGPVVYDPASYGVHDVNAYDFEEYAPFYELGDEFRVAVVDMPQTKLSERVNGIQVLGWGSHSPQSPSASLPAGLLEEIRSRYGEHPLFLEDSIVRWKRDSAQQFLDGLTVGVARRAAICRDLVREPWNLFLTVFGEFHSASHYLWHFSQPHPLARSLPNPDDPLRRIMQAIDGAIGQIVAEAPQPASVIVFSVHGAEANNMDLTSNLFLPELLYRFSFPGRTALAPPRACPPLRSAPRLPSRNIWMLDAWNLRDERNPLKPFLRRHVPHELYHRLHLDRVTGPGERTPLRQHPAGAAYLSWLPSSWYMPVWPEMMAFALPSFSDGYVRINLRGREPRGVVEPSEYGRVGEGICALLDSLRDARTGKRVVLEVRWIRSSPDDDDPRLPPADLLVLWDPDATTDVVESERFGRIGPVPYHRTGGHSARGFLLARGPGLRAGARLPDGDVLDVTPTILAMVGAPIPSHHEGKALVGEAF